MMDCWAWNDRGQYVCTQRYQIESSTHLEAILHMRQLVLQGRDSRIQRFGGCSIFLFEAVLDSVHTTYVSNLGVEESSR